MCFGCPVSSFCFSWGVESRTQGIPKSIDQESGNPGAQESKNPGIKHPGIQVPKNSRVLESRDPEIPWTNTTWGYIRKYNIGQKQKIHVEANAENISGTHDESPNGGGRRRRPPHTMCPANIFSMCSASIFCFCPILYFLMLAHLIVYSWVECTWPMRPNGVHWAPRIHGPHGPPWLPIVQYVFIILLHIFV